MKNSLTRLITKNYRIISLVSIAILLPLMYLVVYKTGGTRYVYPQLMYLPILVAGIFLGGPYGVIVGLIGGLILGPIMPLDVGTGESQTFLNWSFRLILFVIIGGVTGIFSDIFRKKISELRDILKINQYTKVPNIEYFKSLPNDDKQYTVVTIVISNRRYFLDLFGLDNVNKIIFKTYQNLLRNLPNTSIVFQADADKFWCLIAETDLEVVKTYVLNALNQEVVLNTANVYVEYYVGFGKLRTIKEAKTMEPFARTDECARKAEINNIQFVHCDDLVVKEKYDYDLLSEFYNALKNNETFLAYHPVYDLKNNMEIYKIEALIRWMHPTKGLINPNDFIPLIENTQLVHPLMEWVLDKIIDKVKEFKAKGINVRIFMNISGKNFYNKELVYKITEKLNEKNINPSNIGIEITESVLLNNLEESRDMIKQLTDLGIKISIDDFGKGYSSLSYLAHFNIDFLKMDKVFIARLEDPTNLVVVRAALDLAKQLDFRTVAEGVENEKTLKRIKELGFDFAQGFYFCKPIPQDNIIDFYIENSGKSKKTTQV